jgi:signal transduction histidine kinase
MVREVLDNLVGNALKHAGSAAVTARAEGEHVRFDVRDEGPGIPEDEQSRLFDRWTRTTEARKGAVGGFGLGLSIVKRLVVAHGGTLGVSSRAGEGATFWVTFPQQRSAPLVAERRRDRGAARRGRRHRSARDRDAAGHRARPRARGHHRQR